MYQIYGYDLSYFTQKIEAAMRFYQLDYCRRPRTLLNGWWLERRSGTRLVPVLKTPDGHLLHDSTRIIKQLDVRYPSRRLIPRGLNGALVRVLEEWFDEWLPRMALSYRWQFADCERFGREELSKELVPGAPGFVRRRIGARVAAWGKRACRANGLDFDFVRKSGEIEVVAAFTAINEQLRHSRYVLGDRPTAVDAVIIGGIRAHFGRDPEPMKMMQRFERLHEWATRDKPWDGYGELPAFETPTPFAEKILLMMGQDYRRFVLANASALKRGAKIAETYIDSQPMTFVARQPIESSRRLIEDYLIDNFDAAVQTRLFSWLTRYDLHDVFLPGGNAR